MVYFNEIKTGDTTPVKKPVNSTNVTPEKQKIKVFPEKSKTENNSDNDLPQGYYVEKSDEEPKPEQPKAQEPVGKQQDDDDFDLPPDTDIDTNKLEMPAGIALGHTETIDDAIDAAALRGLNSTVEDGNKLDKAQTMIKEDQNGPLKENFKKGIHGVSVIRAEKTSYDVGVLSLDAKKENETVRADQILTYESKSGKTKLMFTGTYIQTKTDIKTRTSINGDSDISNETDETLQNMSNSVTESGAEQTDYESQPSQKIKDYCFYVGLNQKLKKDELYASIVHADGKAGLDNLKTTSVECEYFSDKYNFTLEGNAILTDIGSLSSAKTNLSFRFNTKEDENPKEVKSEEPATEENETEVTENTENKAEPQNTKKWKKKGGLIIKYEDIDGVGEKGIGYYFDNKKKTQNTNTKFTLFAVGSMTQRKDEKDSYYATAGAEFKYKNQINNDTKFEANANVINKYAFCGPDKGNTTTTQFRAKLTNPRVTAEVKGKGIILPESKYAGVTAKISWKPTKKIQGLEVFTRGDYLYEKTNISKTSGGSLLGGISYSF